MIEKFKESRLWKYTFFTAVVLALCTHLPIMLSDIPNHDGLASIYFDQNMLVSGRWFLSIACGFSSYYALPWLIGLLSIVILAFTSVLLVEVFEIEKVHMQYDFTSHTMYGFYEIVSVGSVKGVDVEDMWTELAKISLEYMKNK